MTSAISTYTFHVLHFLRSYRRPFITRYQLVNSYRHERHPLSWSSNQIFSAVKTSKTLNLMSAGLDVSLIDASNDPTLSPGSPIIESRKRLSALSDDNTKLQRRIDKLEAQVRSYSERDATSSSFSAVSDLEDRLAQQVRRNAEIQKSNDGTERHLRKLLDRISAIVGERVTNGDDAIDSLAARIAALMEGTSASLERAEAENRRLRRKNVETDRGNENRQLTLAKTRLDEVVRENQKLRKETKECACGKLMGQEDDNDNVKRRLEGMEERLREKDLEIAKLSTELSEAKLERVLDDPAIVKRQSNGQSEVEGGGGGGLVGAAVDGFENLFRQQCDDISGLCEAKAKFVKYAQNVDVIIRAHEKYEERLSAENAQLREKMEGIREMCSRDVVSREHQDVCDAEMTELRKLQTELTMKNEIVVGAFSNFVTFVREAGSASNDETLQQRVLAECARVVSLCGVEVVERRNIQDVAMKAFEVVGSDETPVRELLTLISALVEMNRVLSSNFEEAKNRLSGFWALQQAAVADVNAKNTTIEDVTKQNKALKRKLRTLVENASAECDRVKVIAANTEKRMRRNEAEYQCSLEKLANEKQEYLREVIRLRSVGAQSNGDHVKETQEKEQKISDMKKRYEHDVSGLKQENESLKARCEAAKRKIAESEESIGQITAENLALDYELQRITSQSDQLRHTNQACDGERKRAVEELEQRSVELRGKYEGTVARLERDVTSARNDYQRMSAELEQSSSVQQKLKAENARLHVTERTLSLKIDTISTALDRERRDFENKQLALQRSHKNILESKERSLVEYQNLLRGFVTSILGISVAEDISVSSMLDLIQAGLKTAETVSSGSNILELEHQLHNARETESGLKKYASEVSTWEQWAKGLHSQISSSTRLINSVQLRSTLGTALLSVAASRALTNKFDILKSEKKILTTVNPKLLRTNGRHPCTSIRPLIIIIFFHRKLIH